MPHSNTPPLPAPERYRIRPAIALVFFLLVLGLRAHDEPTNKNRTPRSRAVAAADATLDAARAAEARGDPAAALRLFASAAATRPNDPVILQKISKQYSDLSDDLASPVEKRRLLVAALAAAQRAVSLQPRSAVNVLSLAICYGKLARLADNRTKVEYARLIHDYADRAIALDPNYALAHHVLGRWFYEVAGTAATKRFFARLFYGDLPPASLADALREFRRAAELDPQSPANHTELGFVLRAGGNEPAAASEFARALALPPRDKHDADALRRARAALATTKED